LRDELVKYKKKFRKLDKKHKLTLKDFKQYCGEIEINCENKNLELQN
jgi:hypothetical protein